ncbi:KRT72 isoform 5, partial [Pan troglodytes]
LQRLLHGPLWWDRQQLRLIPGWGQGLGLLWQQEPLLPWGQPTPGAQRCGGAGRRPPGRLRGHRLRQRRAGARVSLRVPTRGHPSGHRQQEPPGPAQRGAGPRDPEGARPGAGADQGAKQQVRLLHRQDRVLFLVLEIQVRFLEQQNQVLETKWNLLQQLELNNCRKNLEPIYEGYISNLQKQLEMLSGDRV